VEKLAVFAPIAITVVLAGADSPTTATVCAIYFFARLVHYPVATLGVLAPAIVLAARGGGARLTPADIGRRVGEHKARFQDGGTRDGACGCRAWIMRNTS